MMVVPMLGYPSTVLRANSIVSESRVGRRP